MVHIPQQPIPYMVIGLAAVIVTVLILPLKIKRVEENLERFFLVMGAIAVTISGLWSWELITEALRAPVMIGRAPVGIFQVVLVFGLLVHYFNRLFQNKILSVANKLTPKVFIFLLILVSGLVSSIFSVIVTACILSEILAAVPYTRDNKIKVVVLACFAAGLGGCLTPVGEPLATILVQKLSCPPYNADFLFPLRTFGVYIIPGIAAIATFGSLYIGKNLVFMGEEVEAEYTETLKTVMMRAIKVYMFVAALILLGEGLKPLIIWYFTKVPAWMLYWVNIVSAILDNATLTAVEIGPTMALPQIIGITMGLLISGGILIPGNIPNIIAAGRLGIKMREWAAIGVPLGLALMVIFFIAMVPLFLF